MTHSYHKYKKELKHMSIMAIPASLQKYKCIFENRIFLIQVIKISRIYVASWPQIQWIEQLQNFIATVFTIVLFMFIFYFVKENELFWKTFIIEG